MRYDEEGWSGGWRGRGCLLEAAANEAVDAGVHLAARRDAADERERYGKVDDERELFLQALRQHLEEEKVR